MEERTCAWGRGVRLLKIGYPGLGCEDGVKFFEPHVTLMEGIRITLHNDWCNLRAIREVGTLGSELIYISTCQFEVCASVPASHGSEITAENSKLPPHSLQKNVVQS